MPIVVTTPATVFPVTRAQVKTHCRAGGGTSEDTYFDGLIASAVSYVEAYCGRSFTAQTLTLYLDKFADGMILPRGPVGAVTKITYSDAEGATQTLAEAVYEADLFSDPAMVTLADGQTWPATATRKNAVAIEYKTSADDVPAAVTHAMLLLIGHWYASRESATELPLKDLPQGVEALLCNFRSYGC